MPQGSGLNQEEYSHSGRADGQVAERE